TYDEALKDYTKAIELNPKNEKASYTRGNLYSKNPDTYDEALKDYTKAIDLNPDLACAYFDKLELLLCWGKYSEAQDALKEASRFSKEDNYPIIYPFLESILSTVNPNLGNPSDLEAIIKQNKEIKIEWGFEELDSWLKRTEDLSEEQKTEIKKLIDMVKEHIEETS
ncbi:MAG: tetratricopeptide repeat protein, partial [SAR324 cluster bacterium]|nr:tetratricopeptide repeat protein [SAR324 cluster bacterium]